MCEKCEYKLAVGAAVLHQVSTQTLVTMRELAEKYEQDELKGLIDRAGQLSDERAHVMEYASNLIMEDLHEQQEIELKDSRFTKEGIHEAERAIKSVLGLAIDMNLAPSRDFEAQLRENLSRVFDGLDEGNAP